jgi:hypothetical protein
MSRCLGKTRAALGLGSVPLQGTCEHLHSLVRERSKIIHVASAFSNRTQLRKDAIRKLLTLFVHSTANPRRRSNRAIVAGDGVLPFGVLLSRLPYYSRPELTHYRAFPREPSCGHDRPQDYLAQSQSVL